MSKWKVAQGDCLAVLKTAPDNFFDAMVSDPPAGISFMPNVAQWDCFRRRNNPADVGRDTVFGRTSEHAPHSYGESDRGNFIAFMTAAMKEACRTLKPGAHALVWALPRTSHWTAMAIEDAGMEIRDCLVHAFGQGFPKSKNLGDGFGSALKPGHELWILARKPVEGSITANFAAWGTGGLNIDACRVNRAADDVPGWHKSGANGAAGYNGTDTFAIREMSPEEIRERCSGGRWPPNLLLSHSLECADECAADCPVAELDRQAPKAGGGFGVRGSDGGNTMYGGGKGLNRPTTGQTVGYGDSGGASRFFPTFRYQAKPARGEKEAGLDALPVSTLNRVNPGGLENEPRFAPVQVRNNHPTVKSIELMRWLCRLITPPGGAVLDPFAGSGSTGCAALLEGFDFFGIEQDPHYCDIARARLTHWAAQK